MVQEGGSFLPLITVSHLVNATFNVYIPSGDGTAGNDDYLFEGEYVNFGPTVTMNTTNSSVVIATDNLVEPNETFKVVLQFISSPSDIEELLNLNNPNETVTIIDDNSEYLCLFITYSPFGQDIDHIKHSTMNMYKCFLDAEKKERTAVLV